MDNYSSKICNKCFSPQEPHARFCDNCGKRFAATAATDGNISINTKTFLKRQVSETRPFFWLCVIIIGMLGVFGFAQAGIYFAGSAGPDTMGAPKATAFVSKESRDTANEPQSAEQATQPTNEGLLDLNNSVFEMRDRETVPTTHAAVKRKAAIANEKPQPKTEEKAEAVDTVTVPAWEQPEAAIPKTAPAKSEDNDSGPRRFLRGPMGGCFYISASGNKHYVDRGLCN